MARRRLITDEELLKMLKNYIANFCDGRSATVKIPEFGNYLRDNGYPKVQDYLIRRNTMIRKYLIDQRKVESNSNRYILATYRTLDVDLFLETNCSISSMKRALSELNVYYRSICEAATALNNESHTSIEKMEEYRTELTNIEKENLELSMRNKELKSLNKNLQSLNKEYKTIIESYVYPEIANELLKEDGLINETQQIINSEILSETIITAQTPIKSDSKIIQGLFKELER